MAFVQPLAAQARRNPRRLTPWPMARPRRWAERVNKPLTTAEPQQVYTTIHQSKPFGDQTWVHRTLRNPASTRPCDYGEDRQQGPDTIPVSRRHGGATNSRTVDQRCEGSLSQCCEEMESRA